MRDADGTFRKASWVTTLLSHPKDPSLPSRSMPSIIKPQGRRPRTAGLGDSDGVLWAAHRHLSSSWAALLRSPRPELGQSLSSLVQDMEGENSQYGNQITLFRIRIEIHDKMPGPSQ